VVLLAAHVDANVVGDLLGLTNGATPAVTQAILGAAQQGRLFVPFSTVTTEELLRAPDPPRSRLLRLYGQLANSDQWLPEAWTVLRDDIVAYASGSAPPRPAWTPMPTCEQQAWHALANGCVPVEDFQAAADQAGAQVAQYLGVMHAAHDETVAAFSKAKRSMGRSPSFKDLWPELGPLFARSFAQRVGVWPECAWRGADGLLRLPAVLAAAGAMVDLIRTAGTAGRRAQPGDSRDLRHLVHAVAADGLLVTHDRPLRDLVKRVEGLAIEVLSARELAERL
jgi:hypothetical protein